MRSTDAPPSPLGRLPPPELARVAGGYTKTAIDTAVSLGADLDRLGEACGLPSLATELPEAIPATSYLALLEAAAAQLAEPCFGLKVGERAQLSTFVGYGLVLCTCPDLRAVVEQTLRFEALAHDLGRSELLLEHGVAHYRWHSPWTRDPRHRHLAESVMAGIRAFGTWLAGRPPPLIDLAFEHPAPPDVPMDTYERVFGGPVRFGAPVTEARFLESVLDTPNLHADPAAAPIVTLSVESRLASRQREVFERSIVQAVRQRIRATLAHSVPRLPEVAEALGMTTRTLQRKLFSAGASFVDLLDDVRRELALVYLLDRDRSLTDVALLLGFSELSNFSHAFRAWFGTTPSAWRQGGGHVGPAGAAGPRLQPYGAPAPSGYEGHHGLVPGRARRRPSPRLGSGRRS